MLPLDWRGFTISNEMPLNRTEGLFADRCCESCNVAFGVEVEKICDSMKSLGVCGGCGNGYFDNENVDVLAVLWLDEYNPSVLLMASRRGAGRRLTDDSGRGRRLIGLK